MLSPRARAPIAGDAIASHDGKPILGAFIADPARTTVTFRRLAALNVELACFGHGDPLLADPQAGPTRAAQLRVAPYAAVLVA